MPLLERPDGGRVWFEVHDRGFGPAVLLLEGLGGDAGGWGETIERLAAGRCVVALDARGNGRSDPLVGPASMDLYVEDAMAVLDELEVARAHLYGRSFGGMVAIQAALSHPSRVRSLVLAATHAGASGATRPGPDGRVPKDRPWLALFSDGFVREHPERVRAHAALAGSEARRRRPQWQAMRTWDVWDRIGLIGCPTLVVHGTGDRLVPVENARRLASSIPGAELVLLEGAGHAYQWEQPGAADAAVLDFLDRVEAMAA